MEGDPKLQAEKPHPKREDELFGAILEELSLFIQRYKGLSKRSDVVARAIRRAAELLGEAEDRLTQTLKGGSAPPS